MSASVTFPLERGLLSFPPTPGNLCRRQDMRPAWDNIWAVGSGTRDFTEGPDVAPGTGSHGALGWDG